MTDPKLIKAVADRITNAFDTRRTAHVGDHATEIARLILSMPEVAKRFTIEPESVEYEPDDGIEYWAARTGVLVHEFKYYRGAAIEENRTAWCGANLVGRVRRIKGQGKCGKCQNHKALDAKRALEAARND